MVFLPFELTLDFFLLLLQLLLLPLALLAVTVVVGEVAVLAHAFRVVELVSVLARPSLLRFSDLVLADHAPFDTVGACFTTLVLFIATDTCFFKTLIILTCV